MQFKPLSAGRFYFADNMTAILQKPFDLSVHEVTQAQYQKIMVENPSRLKNPQNPVESVTSDDAKEFCRKLSELPEEKAAGYVYRLPTIEEWEYAARTGTKTDYSFGEDESLLGEYAWYATNSEQKSHPVGQKKPNRWGFYDMYGNVWEWVKYDTFTAPERGPDGKKPGYYRVYCGGSWQCDAEFCNSFKADFDLPTYTSDQVGFRVARVKSDGK